MIFQAGIKLDIKDRDVQAIIDFDTGLIGFTEIINNESKEYYFSEGPKEFKLALFNKLEDLLAKRNHLNLKICGKNREIMNLTKNLSKNRKVD